MTTEKGTKIGENSWISIGLAMALLSGACWASLVYAQVGQSKQDIQELKERQTRYAQELKEVNKQLATIQGMLLGRGYKSRSD